MKLERFLVRRQPLGSDRFNRMYWWGLAGNKEGLLLQQETGCAETALQLLQQAGAEAAAAADKQQGGDQASALDVGQQRENTAGPSAGNQTTCTDTQSPDSQDHGHLLNSQSLPKLSWPLDHKGLLLPAGPEGWAVIDDLQLLEGLLASLEQRGVREKELKQTLEKVRHDTDGYMKRHCAGSQEARAPVSWLADWWYGTAAAA